MNLNNFIYDFNLSTTGTVADIYERCRVTNNGRKREIDFKDSISLYDIVKKFNTAYLAFSLESDELKKMLNSLGKEVSYLHHSTSENFVALTLGVENPYNCVFHETSAVVSFVNKDNEFYVMADNGRRIFDKEYQNIRIDIDNELVMKCLEIIRRHDLLIESFVDLKNKFVFGDGTTVVFTKIDGDILDPLSTFTLSFGNHYLNTYDFIEVKFKLGEELEILYDESKIVFSSDEIEDVEAKRKIIDELLGGIYINKDKLCNLFKMSEDKKVLEKRNEV